MSTGRIKSISKLVTGDEHLDRIQDHLRAQLNPVLQATILSAKQFRWNEAPYPNPTSALCWLLQISTGSTWKTVAAWDQSGTLILGSTPPGGTAGGDLVGTYPNPTLATSGVGAGAYGSAANVAQVTFDAKGRATAAANVPISIGVAAVSGAQAGPLTGDVTTSGAAATLAASGVAAATYGSTSTIPQVAVDAKGRITSASNVAPSLPASAISSGTLAAAQMPALTGDVTSSAGTTTTALAASGVVANTYGSTSTHAQVTVDAKGRVTAASSVTPSLPASAITSGTLALAQGGTGNTTGQPSGTAGGALAGTYPNPTLAVPGDSAWTAPTLLNSWTQFGASSATVGYFKDASGFVHLRGAVALGVVGSAAFTLPLAYRPTAILRFTVVSNGAFGRIDVLNTGDVTPQTPDSNAWVSLDGIVYDTR